MTDALEPAESGVPSMSMPRLMELAIREGKIDALERLVALDEHLSARRAAQEFAEAMSKFKETCPPVPRRAENSQFSVTRNGTKQARRYATLEDIEATVRGPLGSCGLSFRWGDAIVQAGMLTLPCVVAHVGGHSVVSSVTLPLESRAGCSEAQKYGAVMTYAQRYSLIQVLGLTTCDEDVDGEAPRDPGLAGYVTPEQVIELEALLGQRPDGSRAKFLKYLGIEHMEEIPADRFASLKADLERKIRGGA